MGGRGSERESLRRWVGLLLRLVVRERFSVYKAKERCPLGLNWWLREPDFVDW